MPRPAVLTIGAATQDVFLESAQFKIIRDPTFSTGEAECFALGSKIDIPTVLETIGGGAANSAIAFARFGFSVGCATRLGADGWGREVLRRLRSEHVRPYAAVDRTRRTGLSVLLLTRRGERTVLVHRGAAAVWRVANLPAVTPRCYYLTSVAGSRRLVEAVVRRSRRQGATLAWNPGAGELAWGWRRIRPLLPGSILILNQFEARQLTRRISARETLRALIRAGCRTAVITVGKNGAMASDGRTPFRSGIHNLRVTDTTGAGDAFGSGFVAALLRGRPLAVALQLATANSESVIQRVGATPGLRRTLPTPRQRVAVVRLPR